MRIAVLGVDLGKNVCSVVGLDEAGAVVVRRRARRDTLIGSSSKFAAVHCRDGGLLRRPSSWPDFAAQGHDVRLMSPEYVRPYVKAQKNDDRDAEGIAEAATRPTMRFVELKSQDQLDMQTLHRSQGPAGRRADGSDQPVARNPAGARNCRAAGQAQARAISRMLMDEQRRSGTEPADAHADRRRSRAMGRSSIDGSRPSTRSSSASAKESEDARRLTTIPGFGVLIATALDRGDRQGRDV